MPDGIAWSVTITASDRVEATNRIIVEAAAPGRPTVGLIPVTILG